MTEHASKLARRGRSKRRALATALISGLALTATIASGAPAFASAPDLDPPETAGIAGTVEVVDDGLIRYDAWVHDKLPGGVFGYHVKCPDGWPYLKRYHTGGYERNAPVPGPPMPGGALVYSANGTLAITGFERGESWHYGKGPEGSATYRAVNGIEGTYASLGATDMRIVLWCVSDPFNGAVSDPY
ncbi:hypothetical protein [Agromyces aerolatus]|uniref:hypothetical protein n=1 Tax=Agromyces sp. LY-1074 TaxID=3074080 RepID=UPI002858E7A1|nr:MULTISPECIES: hypothetical protein [unclassified Agromyces]MDR5701036.1 hypothetical protein [Agromyces sp. LY-1074]MDR5707676.1 hypothetical protein [Agromyces sp. LY-1358]